MRFPVLCLLIASSGITPVSAQTLNHTLLPLQTPGGYAITDDLVGLIVSVPESMELVYFNTSSEREVKRVELEFKPAAMCLQGKTLYVAQQGSALVHALDVQTAKPRKTYELDGDAVVSLACAPGAGPVFASTGSRAVHAINPKTGTVQATTGNGFYLAVSPNGQWLFTGFQPKDSEFDYKATEDLDRRIKIPWDGTWGTRAQILKYKIADNGLTFEAVQSNAASNGWSFHLSPDGARVAMPGGGGWRPVDGGRGEYATAIFSTSNLTTMLGQAPSATAIAFHPVLDLGMSHHSGRTIQFFRAKSFKLINEIEVAKEADGSPSLFTFGGKGTKAILWNGHNPANQLAGLHFVPLELCDEELLALVKAYGKLPEPVVVAASDPRESNSPLEEPEVPQPKPAAATKGPASRRPTGVAKAVPLPAFKPASKVPMGSSGGEKPPARAVNAVAGFNDAKGLCANKQKFSPYPVTKMA